MMGMLRVDQRVVEGMIMFEHGLCKVDIYAGTGANVLRRGTRYCGGLTL